MSARGRTRPVAARATATPGEIAWIAAIACGLLLAAAIALLGVPFGQAFFEPTKSDWWPFWGPRLGHVPEPEERAAYLFALVAPLLLCALVVLAAVRRPALPPAATAALARASGVLLVAFAVVCLVVQHVRTFGPPYYGSFPFHRVYFTLPTLLVAALLAGAAVALLRRDALLARVVGWARESRARAVAAALVAVVATVVSVLPGLHTDASIGTDSLLTWVNIPFWIDETFAVLNGRLPLVDFHAQYSQLIPYLAAGPMALFGSSLALYSALFVGATTLGLLALYALLRRVARSSLLALGLYLPVLATGFFTEAGPPENRHGPVTLFSMFPMRYAGAYALAWLTARHLDGARPRRGAPLFFAAGLVAINNVDFGLPTLGATLVAVVLSQRPHPWSNARRLAADLALGLLGALAAVTLLTLAVGGALPHFGMALTFARLYGIDGFTSVPMPEVGFHLAIYATFVAALVVAVVRACTDAEDRLLTAMLAWVGVFGLGAGAYYVGRSLPEVLISLFSVWALALALLLIVVVRALARRPARWPTVPELAVLIGFGIAVCSLAQTPTPWTQLERLGRDDGPPSYVDTPTERFVARHAPPGERVAILIPVGHRIAYDVDVVNVSPYSFIEAMPFRRNLAETIAELRAEGGTMLFLPLRETQPEVLAAAEQAGFRLVERGSEAENAIALVDARRTG